MSTLPVNPIDLCYDFEKKAWSSGKATVRVYPAGQPEDIRRALVQCTATPPILDFTVQPDGQSGTTIISLQLVPDATIPADHRVAARMDVSSPAAGAAAAALSIAGAGVAGHAAAQAAFQMKAEIPIRLNPYGVQIRCISRRAGTGKSVAAGAGQGTLLGIGTVADLDCDGLTELELVPELIEIAGREVRRAEVPVQFSFNGGVNRSWGEVRPSDAGTSWVVKSTAALVAHQVHQTSPSKLEFQARLPSGVMVKREVLVMPKPLKLVLTTSPEDARVGFRQPGQEGSPVRALATLTTQAGQPAAHVPVTWSLTEESPGTLKPLGDRVDAEGKASCLFMAPTLEEARQGRPRLASEALLDLRLGSAKPTDVKAGRVRIAFIADLDVVITIAKPGFDSLRQQVKLSDFGACAIKAVFEDRKKRTHPVLHADVSADRSDVEVKEIGGGHYHLGITKSQNAIENYVLPLSVLPLKMDPSAKLWQDVVRDTLPRRYGSEPSPTLKEVMAEAERFADGDFPRKLTAMTRDEHRRVIDNMSTLASLIRVADAANAMVMRRYERFHAKLASFFSNLANVFISLFGGKILAATGKALVSVLGKVAVKAQQWKIVDTVAKAARDKLTSLAQAIEVHMRKLSANIRSSHKPPPEATDLFEKRMREALEPGPFDPPPGSMDSLDSISGVLRGMLNLLSRMLAVARLYALKHLLGLMQLIQRGASRNIPQNIDLNQGCLLCELVEGTSQKWAIDQITSVAGETAPPEQASDRMRDHVRRHALIVSALCIRNALKKAADWPDIDRHARTEAMRLYHELSDARSHLKDASEAYDEGWHGTYDDMETYAYYSLNAASLILLLVGVITGPLTGMVGTAAGLVVSQGFLYAVNLLDAVYTSFKTVREEGKFLSAYNDLPGMIVEPVWFAEQIYARNAGSLLPGIVAEHEQAYKRG